MGVTYADILNYNGAMEASANGWGNLLAGVEESATYLQKNAIAPSAQAWAGTAKQLFANKFQQTHGGLIQNQSNWNLIKQNLMYFDQDMQSWQFNLKTLLKQIESGSVPGIASYPPGYYSVSPDGVVTLVHQFTIAQEESTAGTNQVIAFEKTQAQLQDQINNIVSGANQLDVDTAKALARYFPKAQFQEQTPVTQQWTTVSGYGSLWQIAQSEYGNPDLWTKIWAANPNIKDPNVIPVNLKVLVPPLTTAIGPATIKAPAAAPATSPGTTSATAPLTPQQAYYNLAIANGVSPSSLNATPAAPTTATTITPEQAYQLAIANGVAPSQLNPTPTTTTSFTDPGTADLGSANPA
jgi:hypothetical protein